LDLWRRIKNDDDDLYNGSDDTQHRILMNDIMGSQMTLYNILLLECKSDHAKSAFKIKYDSRKELLIPQN